MALTKAEPPMVVDAGAASRAVTGCHPHRGGLTVCVLAPVPERTRFAPPDPATPVLRQDWLGARAWAPQATLPRHERGQGLT